MFDPYNLKNKIMLIPILISVSNKVRKTAKDYTDDK